LLVDSLREIATAKCDGVQHKGKHCNINTKTAYSHGAINFYGTIRPLDGDPFTTEIFWFRSNRTNQKLLEPFRRLKVSLVGFEAPGRDGWRVSRAVLLDQGWAVPSCCRLRP